MSRRDPFRWMWLEAFESLERAERMHRKFFELAASPGLGPVWEPPVDFFETEEELCILVALPGVREDRIKVGIHDGSLVISGGRSLPMECRAATIHRLEIPYGRFERIIPLPPGRFELKERRVEDGCLLLNLRKHLEE
ncbi:MAG: Hsp20 family protein [Candidatus Eisenbacteria bacterium]|nr:Hsp20 family protein [Candidatus Eisenbacteria bacterium]